MPSNVRLRALRDADLELLVEHMGVGGPATKVSDAVLRRRLARRISRSGRFVEGRLDLGVEVGGRLVGGVEARRPKGAWPPGVAEIGIGLFAESDRGRGIGTEAVRLLTERLFSEHGVARVQASTAVGNAAMRSVLERLGYRFEGVLRGFMPGPDGREDYALYGVTLEDWRATRG